MLPTLAANSTIPEFTRPPKSPTPLQLASMELGSSAAIPSPWLIMPLHPPASPALGYGMAARAESKVALLLRPAAKGSNLAAGGTVFCRRCLPVPGAQGFLPTALWSHCQGPPLQVSWSPHSPYTGSSVKAWVWWLKAQPRNTEFTSGTSFATSIILPGPAPHDTGVMFSIQSLQNCFMGKWIQLLHAFQIHSAWTAFVSVHLFAWNMGILDQCKQFLHFWICWIILALRLHNRYLHLHIFC